MVRGRHEPQVTMLAFIDLETRVPPDHPLRVIKKLADQALKALSPDLDRMYADVGRPSIPPERLLKSSLLIALYSVRSERGFCEQLAGCGKRARRTDMVGGASSSPTISVIS